MSARVSLVLASLLLALLPCRAQVTVRDASATGLGDSLLVSFTLDLSSAAPAPRGAVVARPVLSSADGKSSVSLAPAVRYGRGISRKASRLIASGDPSERVVAASSGLSAVYSVRIPASPWDGTVRLSVSVGSWSRRGGVAPLSDIGLVSFSRPPRPAVPEIPWTLMEPSDDNSYEREASVFAPLAFAPGSGDLDPLLNGNDSLLRRLSAFIRPYTAEGSLQVRRAELVCYVAPGGDPKAAETLTRKRVASVYNHLRKEGLFRRFTPARRGGGWNMGGVLEWISRSAFARDQVVTGVFSGKPDRRALEGLSVSRPAVSDILARDCYPEVGGILFRCAVRSPRFRTGADIEPVALATPDILSAYDWWRLSGIYPEGSDRWLDTLLEAAARFPEEPAFAYNAAMALMARGAWDAAAPVVRRLDGTPEGRYAGAVLLLGRGEAVEAGRILVSLPGEEPARLRASIGDLLDWDLGRVPWVTGPYDAGSKAIR